MFRYLPSSRHAKKSVYANKVAAQPAMNKSAEMTLSRYPFRQSGAASDNKTAKGITVSISVLMLN